MLQDKFDIEGRKNQRPPLHILVCPDRPLWASDNIANNIERHCGPNRITKLYMRDVIGNEHVFYETILLKRIDLCHIFWREDMFYLLNPVVIAKAARRLGLDYPTLVRALNSCAFTSSVYDHLFEKEAEIRDRRASFALLDGYTVSSRKLGTIYSGVAEIPPPDIEIPDGVDIAHFEPRATERPEGGSHVLGWVGNSAWGLVANCDDVKGYRRIFRPTIDILRQRGLPVEEKVADPQVRRVPFAEMPDFYRHLDVFLSTSAMEGTPNPVLEAMACGIPIVSTDVGIVPEAFGELQSRFIIADGSPERFADAVVELLADPELRRRIGAENRANALEWSWEKKTRDWWPFWEKVIRRSMDDRNAIRRELYLLAKGVLLHR
ncbi:MAG: hypothetical protein CML30_17645 [Rhizobiales bacterium]|nr:hypothetical protein [Hyphomicrobiales bacterium]